MIALVGSSNWDKTFDQEQNLVLEGPGGGTLNTLTWLAEQNLQTLLVSQKPKVVHPKLEAIYQKTSFIETVEVEDIYKINVFIDKHKDRSFSVDNPQKLPFPALPETIQKAKVIDLCKNLSLANTEGLNGKIVASIKRTNNLVRHGKSPFLTIDSMENYKLPDCNQLLEWGCALCVMTNGAKGGWYWQGEWKEYTAQAAEKVVDTTGCGDAFRAGMCYGIYKDLNIETTLKIASRWGAECAGFFGGNKFCGV